MDNCHGTVVPPVIWAGKTPPIKAPELTSYIAKLLDAERVPNDTAKDATLARDTTAGNYTIIPKRLFVIIPTILVKTPASSI